MGVSARSFGAAAAILLIGCGGRPAPLAFLPDGTATGAVCPDAVGGTVSWPTGADDWCPVFAAVEVVEPTAMQDARAALARVRSRAIELDCVRDMPGTDGFERCSVQVEVGGEPACRAVAAALAVALAADRRATLQVMVGCGGAADHATYDAALGVVVVSTSLLGEHRFRLVLGD